MKTIYYKKVPALGFEKNGRFYIYDRYSNKIISVPQIIYLILDDLVSLDVNCLIEKYGDSIEEDDIRRLVSTFKSIQNRENVLFPMTMNKFSLSDSMSTTDKVVYKLSHEITFLCISLTEQCNLRCSYCIYSGKYKSVRTHNNNGVVDWETVKFAIDYFILCSTESKYRRIGFYGGEPLLNYKILEKAVIYAKGKCSNYLFTVTTNGTLLTNKVIDFLVQNDVRITISLDGPKEIHDSNRKTGNGAGSYLGVMKNINYIKETYPEYFGRYLGFSVTISPQKDILPRLISFFNTVDFPSLKNEGNMTVQWVNPEENEYYKEVDYRKWARKMEVEIQQYFKKVHLDGVENVHDLSPVLKAMSYYKEMSYFHLRENLLFDKYTHYWPNGSCIPGMRSIFLTGKGQFYPCEKLYDIGEFQVGDVSTGLDTDNIIKLIDSYCDKIVDLCSTCWAFRLCGECWTSTLKNGEISCKERARVCKLEKKYWANNIANYLDILECDPNAFDYLRVKDKPLFMSNMLKD